MKYHISLRQHFVIQNVKTTSEQGESLKQVLRQMLEKRPQLKKGESGKVNDIRKEWLGFIDDITQGAFNKCDPSVSGSY